MGQDRLPWPDGAALLGVIANGDDEIENHILVLGPRLTAGLGGIDLVILSQYPENQGVDLTGRIGTGTKGLKSSRGNTANEIFAKNGPRGITSAEEQYFEWSAHRDLGLRVRLASLSGKIAPNHQGSSPLPNTRYSDRSCGSGSGPPGSIP